MTKTVTVSLSAPLLTHKGHVDNIELKEPTVRSFVAYGDPFKTTVNKHQYLEFDYNNDAMLKFLTEMTGIDAALLNGLPARDYITLRATAAQLMMGYVGSEPGNI